jgi:hypothetical protein
MPDMDYHDEADLLGLGLEPGTVSRLLRESPLTGHDGRPVVEAAALRDLMPHPDREDE